APLDRRQRIERETRAVDAQQAPGILGPQALADEREDERLGDTHDRELELRVPDREDRSVRRDDADPEQVRRHACERRVDLRDGAVCGRAIALVRLCYEPACEVGRWELTRGDERRIAFHYGCVARA